jgi:hypothetical protein
MSNLQQQQQQQVQQQRLLLLLRLVLLLAGLLYCRQVAASRSHSVPQAWLPSSRRWATC